LADFCSTITLSDLSCRWSLALIGAQSSFASFAVAFFRSY
jgi:hypothetical protein